MQTKRFLLFLVLIALSATLSAAPKAELLEFWNSSDENNTSTIDHSQWQTILSTYVSIEENATFFSYKDVSETDKKTLDSYIGSLSNIDPKTYSKAEQKAYWINLYNALTVKVILDNYPVKSIRKVGGGVLKSGPWDDKLISINDKALTLNDIEHKILRPIYKDARIHYAVNCASIGCPNLATEVFTAQNMESLLNKSARDFINHERAVSLNNGSLVLSSIYDWYSTDFGDDLDGVIEHISSYASESLKSELSSYKGKAKYDYDWSLNQL